MNAHIAVPYSDGLISPHFGKSSQFRIYTVSNDEVIGADTFDTGVTGHDEIGLWLVQHEVNIVVCGDIGPGAQGALMAAGILLFAGVEGSADDAAAGLVAGTLSASSSATCGRHAGGACGGHCCGHGGACSGCHHDGNQLA